ncbi:U3 snoRNP protein [Rhodotorula kratochvilovae]
MPGLKSSSHKSPSPSKKGKGKQRATASSPAAASPAKQPAPASPAPKQGKASSDQAQQPAAANEEPNELLDLAQSIAENAHLLVRGRGSDELAERARNVLKLSFDKALASESTAFPHLATLLAQLSPSAGPSTRSRSAAAAADDFGLDAEDEPFALAETPIPELTTEGMDAEMVWEQMELRGRTVDGLMEEMFGQGDEEDDGEEGFDFDDEDGEGGEELEDEDEDDEMSAGEGEDLPEAAEEEYYRRLGEGKEEGLDSEDVSFEGMEDDFPEDDDEEEEEAPAPAPKKGKAAAKKKGKAAAPAAAAEDDADADGTRALTLDNFDGEAGSKGRAARRAPVGPPSAVDDDFFSLAAFHADADAGEYEMAKRLRGEALSDDEDELDLDGLDGDGDGGIDLFAPVGGAGMGDGSDEEEEEDLDAGGVMFKDFFDAPQRRGKPPPADKKGEGKAQAKKPAAPAPAAAEEEGGDAAPASAPKKRGVRFSEAVKVKEIPHRLAGKKRAAQADEDEDEDEDAEGIERLEDLVAGSDEEEGAFDEEEDEEDGDEEMEGSEDGMDVDEEEEEEGDEEGSGEEEDDLAEDQQAIERFNADLFGDEEEEEDKNKNLSRHERRLLQLSSQIATLEQENVGPKDWATMGEAKSRDRPVNSLLEEDLEFERMGKVAPVSTEETTASLEDLIKKRILENRFDDVERRVAIDPHQFLPSRYMELQDTKSEKGLAEVYADEFRDAREREQGREVTHELDADLQKRHEDIEALFEELAGRLDALSNAHFTPKAPKAAITTVSNLPSISVESALPTTHSTTTLLAPEEVYALPTGADSALATDKADLTPAQKKALRQKTRVGRKAVAERAERILKSQEKRKGVRGEKEAAERALIGTRGVTVLGKGGVEKKDKGKKRKRGDADGMGAKMPTSVGLKL